MPTDAEDLRIANMALTRLGIGRLTDFSDTSEVASILDDQYDQWVKELIEDHPWNFAVRRETLSYTTYTTTDFNVANNGIVTANETYVEDEGPFRWTVGSDSGDALPSGYEEDTDYYINVFVSGITYYRLKNKRFSNPTVQTITDIGTGTHTFVPTPVFDWSYAHRLPEDCLRVLHVGDYDDKYDWAKENTFICHNVGTTVNIKYIADVSMPDLTSPLFKRALSLKIAVDLVEAGVKTSSVLKEIRDDYLVALQRAKSKDGQEGSPKHVIAGTWADEMGRIS